MYGNIEKMYRNILENLWKYREYIYFITIHEVFLIENRIIHYIYR